MMDQSTQFQKIEQTVNDSDKKLPPESWERAHHFAEGLYAKQMELPAKHTAISHEHNYDHLAILAKGAARVTVENVTTIYRAPVCITIRKGEKHAIEAITDITWFCIHNEEIALCRGQ